VRYPGREGELTEIYRCVLRAPVWTASGTRTVSPPSLEFEQLGPSHSADRLLAKVYIRIDEIPTRDRWMLQCYPLNGPYLPAQIEDGHYFWYRHIPRREPLLEQGELRHPRSTAAEAIRLAMETLAAEDIPKAELAAMGKVAEMLRQPLEHVTASYVTRFRPRRRA
jgi:hypothetical protein